MIRPYYEQDGIVIYNADAREAVPMLSAESIITDPVWPNSIFPAVSDPRALLAETLAAANVARVVVHLGIDSDPRFLSAVPDRWKFIRLCDLDYAMPNPKGRILYGGDVAYVFGALPTLPPGKMLIPGRIVSGRVDRIASRGSWSGKDKRYTRSKAECYQQLQHPAPRRLEHVQWLVRWFAGASVIDPFSGTGTTLLAARRAGVAAVGIEIEERYCEIAAKRLAQRMLPLESGLSVGAVDPQVGISDV